jgi:hypothetical protein
MDRLAPNIVIEGRILGEDAPVRVALRRGTARWTVLVFEPSPDARRLYQLASVRGSFTAEDATLLVVSPTPSEWAEQRVHVVHDAERRISGAFGARGPAAVVIAPDGTIWHAAIGDRPEATALEFVAAMRTGTAIHALSALAPMRRAA